MSPDALAAHFPVYDRDGWRCWCGHRIATGPRSASRRLWAQHVIEVLS